MAFSRRRNVLHTYCLDITLYAGGSREFRGLPYCVWCFCYL